MPAQIRNACAELAYHLLIDDRTAESGLLELESIAVGPITIRKDRTTRKPTFPPSVIDILRPFVVSFGANRVMRA
jgi:hypothetical protein